MLFRRARPWDSFTYWSLDLETGGLDRRRDPILAVGMVPIRAGTVRLGEGFRSLVRPREGRIDPASVRAHQLLWEEVQRAPPLERVLPEVDRRLETGILLVHHAAIDVAFLRRDYRALGMRWPEPRVVDTAALLLRIGRATRPELPDEHRALNLARARAAYGLPEYQAHDALADAVATAELFLALRAALGARTVRELR